MLGGGAGGRDSLVHMETGGFVGTARASLSWGLAAAFVKIPVAKIHCFRKVQGRVGNRRKSG